MAKEHARTGIAHDHPDTLAHFWLVAVYRAFGTSGLIHLIGALVDALQGVSQQWITLCAKAGGAGMMGTAVHENHLGDRAAFTLQAG